MFIVAIVLVVGFFGYLVAEKRDRDAYYEEQVRTKRGIFSAHSAVSRNRYEDKRKR